MPILVSLSLSYSQYCVCVAHKSMGHRHTTVTHFNLNQMGKEKKLEFNQPRLLPGHYLALLSSIEKVSFFLCNSLEAHIIQERERDAQLQRERELLEKKLPPVCLASCVIPHRLQSRSPQSPTVTINYRLHVLNELNFAQSVSHLIYFIVSRKI